MRILIIGAGGAFRTEASLARAARSLGHEAMVLDALGWRRRAGALAGAWLRWRGDAFGPDYVLCTRHAIAAGTPTLVRLLRARDSGFWYFDGLTPLPPRVVELARLVARTFATTGYQAEAFASQGLESHFLPQGTDPGLDYPAPSSPAEHECDVSFVGSGQYRRRHGLLEQMARRFRVQVRGPRWESAPAALPVRGSRVDGADFRAVVRGAAVSLGINALEEQRHDRRGGTSNRLWKVLGAGGLYLGEHVTGVDEFARDGVHAEWYRSPEDAMARVESLLGDPDRRARIAAAGRAHVLAHHTFRHRLGLLLAGQGYTST